MRTIRALALVGALSFVAGLPGCGVSFDVSVHNQSNDALRVELCLVGDQGDLYPQATGDVSPGTAFEYSMRDGPRGEDRVVRVSRLGEPQGTTPAIADVHVGERLLPRGNDFDASLDQGGAVQLRRVVRPK